MAVSLAVTASDTLDPTGDADHDGVADAGDVVKTTIRITHTGNTDALNLSVTDTLNGMTIVPGSVTVTPIAVDDNFNITGNTPITFTAAQLLGNDLDPDGNAAAMTVTIKPGSAQHGTVLDNGNGTYTFTPATGFTGAAQFEYTATDQTGLASISTGTVNVAVSGLTWYVNGSYDGSSGASDGSYTRPFTSLAALNGVTGDGTTNDDVDGAGDTIFVYSGTYTGGIVLESGQRLFGDGHAYSVNGLAIGNSASNAQIDFSDYGVVLAANNEVRGVTLNGTTATATALADGNASVGTLAISNSSIIGAGRAVAIDQGGTLNVQLDTLSSSGSSSAGVHLQGVGGSFSATTGTIQLSLAQGFLVGAAGGATASSGGDINISYGGNILNAGGTSVEIQDRTGGTVSFTGAITEASGAGILVDGSAGTINFGQVNVTSGTSTGVQLSNNSAAINFSGAGTGLDLVTTSGTALIATNNTGALTISGTGNTISTATGAIVNLSNSLVGAGGVEFASLTATGVATGNAFSASNVDGGTFTAGSITVAGATGDGINVSGGSSTNFAFGTATINAVAGDGIEVNASSGSFSVTSGSIGNSDDPAGRGVAVIDGTGTVAIGASISATTAGAVVEVNNHEAGNVTFSGAISATGNTNNGIVVSNVNSGTVLFSGSSQVLSTGINTAVNLTSNAGGTVNFTNGGLAITTAGGAGFNATGGGTVGVSGTGNTVSSGTGTAVNLNGVTNAGMTWQSINTNDANIGINLQNTGAGAFTVTGTGAANSGGTINAATTGINLLNTGALNLTQMNIVGDANSDDGIFGQNVAGLTLNNVDVSGNVNSGSSFDRGVELVNLTGTATITNSTFTNTPGHLFNVRNDSGTLSMTITGSTFSGSTGTFGDDGLLIEANGTSTIRASITGSTFNNNEGDHIQWATDGGASNGHLTISGNTFTTTNPSGVLGGGITISPSGASNLTFAVTNNNITGNVSGSSIDITTLGSTAASLVQGTISGNTVGNAAVPNSGSAQASGLQVDHQGNGTMTVLVENNNIQQWGGAYGIDVIHRAGTGAGGTLNATIRNNTVQNPSTIASFNRAINVSLGTSAASDQGRVFLDLSNNISDTPLVRDISVAAVASVDLYMPGYVGGPDDNAALVSYLTGRNPSGGTVGVTDGASETLDFLNTPGGSAVPLPAAPIAPLLAVPIAASPAEEPLETPIVVPAFTFRPVATPGPEIAPAPVDEPTGDRDAAPTAHPVLVDDGVLTQAELDFMVEAAIQRWIAAGVSEAQVAAMRAASFTVADMAGIFLGTSDGASIAVDSDGAGFGWYLDATPGDDAEFTGSGSRLSGTGDAAGRIDLLTTLMHELGHQIGIEDSYAGGDADDLMYGYVTVGERRLPTLADAASAGSGPVQSTAFALSPVVVGGLPAGKVVEITYRSTVNPSGPGVLPPIGNTTTVSGSNFANVTVNHSLVVDTLTLGGQIFVDTDGNNAFGAGEGVSGVALSLFVDSNGNGSLDGAELTTVIATTTTGANGIYAFNNLGAGNYAVRVDATNFAAAAVLNGRASLDGVADPDDNVDNDDNGVTASGGAFQSKLITLSFNGETTLDGTGQLDINNTLDFGFATANLAPTSTGLSGNAATFTEDGAAVLLDVGSDAVISDASANFAGGTLTVAVTGNAAAAEDVLGIATTATVTATANTVSVSGTQIATYTGGGAGGGALVFTFGSNATAATVTQLVRAISYANSNGAAPSTAARAVTFTLVDGRGTNEGAGSDTLVVGTTVNVVRQNDAPVVPNSPTVAATEQTAVTINPGLAVSDPDLAARNGGAGDFGGAVFAISRNGGASAQDLFGINAAGASFSIVGSELRVGGLAFANITAGGGTLSIAFTSAATAATTALVNEVLGRLQYTNLADAPPASVQLAYSLNDGAPGGGQGAVVAGNDSAGGLVTVTIAAVNDPVTLNAASTAVNGTEDTNLVFSTANGNAITVADLDGDSLTVTLGVASGKLTLAQTTGLTVTGNGSGSVQLAGSAANINAALQGLVYRGNLNYNGSDSLSVNVVDAAAASASTAIAITLAPDNAINGSSGNDTLSGTGSGDLFLVNQPGSETLTGLGGDDGFYFGAFLDATDQIDGGAGTLDQVGLQGNYGTFGAGATPHLLGAGNLVGVEMLVLLSGTDARFGGSGGPYSYNLKTVDANVGANETLKVGFNLLQAGENVTFDGSAETDGSFITYGGFGNDVLTGGQKDDGFFFGVASRFGAGDKVDGQGGAMDQLGLQGLYAGATAISFGADQMTSIEMIVLLTGGDVRFGSGGLGYSYDLTMHDGNVAAGQQMMIQANTLRTDEVLTFNGSAETNGTFLVWGGAAGDTIIGGALGDTLYGRDGADTLRGGLGADTLYGGAGNDTFVYGALLESNAANTDSIMDFAAGDLIDLRAIDAVTGGADNAFTYIGAAGFGGGGAADAGQLRAVAVGDVWTVQGDVDGDGIADFVLSVTVGTPGHLLSAGDFML